MKVAHNLEAARVSALAIQQQLEKEEQEENPLQKKVEEAIDILKELIERQESLLNHTTALMCSPGTTEKAKIEDQAKLKTETAEFTRKLKDVEAMIPKIPDDLKKQLSADGVTIPDSPPSDMSQVIKHVETAVISQGTAVTQLTQQDLDPGSKQQKVALDELEACLKALEEMFTQQNDPQEGEGEESESDDYDESEEYDESESEGDMSDASSAQGEFESNLDSQEIPPPTDDPMDILAEEMENNSMRTKKTPTKYTKVKKDW